LSGRTRATAKVWKYLIKEFPGVGAIQPPNPNRLNDGWIEVAEIHAHSVTGPIGGLPVRDAAAGSASTEPKAFVAPGVTSHGPLAGKNFHLAWIVVAPESAMATTD
jgi:hypothetical protein